MNIANIANGRYLLKSATGYTIKYSPETKYSVYRNGVLLISGVSTQRKCRNVIRNHRLNGSISTEGRE